MLVATDPCETIGKELIPGLHFAPDDVLPTEAARKLRRFDAERAGALGNNYHGKLDIYFRTADGRTKRVQTTVWAVHEEFITLKAGITLPLRAVLGFDFY
ncbi:hypothetical protein [Hymenobacter sp. B81]|uniref:hypothetical protein n=1 Tax=Hymenobacter sp. B81 TaxID=3344878 RepID=UPI0037DC3ADE